MNTAPSQKIAYVGLPGSSLAFSLSGIDVYEEAESRQALSTIRDITTTGEHSIIFVDEALAEREREAITKLNMAPTPAIILLPNPANPRNLAAQNIQDLMIRAIGSDIFT